MFKTLEIYAVNTRTNMVKHIFGVTELKLRKTNRGIYIYDVTFVFRGEYQHTTIRSTEWDKIEIIH